MYSMCIFSGLLLLYAVLQYDVLGQKIHRRDACDNPNHCHTNLYSMECPRGQKIGMMGVYYVAKPYSLCPESREACSIRNRCCSYTEGDCRESYSTKDLFEIYDQCTLRQQCGWLRASSIDFNGSCSTRSKSNYVTAEFKCLYDNSLIDICSTMTRTSKSVYLHHSSFGPYGNVGHQCTCVISPATCNNTATFKFRAIDISLHSRHNVSSCTDQSRLELIGQKERKIYRCKENEFLRGFEKFYDSHQNDLMLYLYKEYLQYPTNILLEVNASDPNVSVTVTCGPDSMTRAHRCPALKLPNLVDDVAELPAKKEVTPTIILLDSEDVDDLEEDDGKNNGEKAENPAIFAIIGGVIAGVVVLLLLLVLVIFILRKRKSKDKRYSQPGSKGYLPKLEELEKLQPANYYETVQEVESNEAPPPGGSGDKGKHIYHKPWGSEGGVVVQNRAKPANLAYATSEEIKVLIEKMEKDRQFLNEGEDDEAENRPDPTYYRHISNYRFRPSETETMEGDSDVVDEDDETESKSNASENCETEKPESEDSKVEADRCVEDSDVESHKVDSETVSAFFDGYESPRVSSFAPSDVSSSVRDSVKSDMIQSDGGPPNFASRSENIIREDSQSDLDDVPSEHAPPVILSNNQSESSDLENADASDDNGGEVTLGAYRTPRGSLDGLDSLQNDENNEVSKEKSHYCDVYDSLKESNNEIKNQDEKTKL